MNNLRRVLVALVCLSVISLAQIPTPESHLGFKVGEDRKVADWEQVVEYFQKVAAATPERVKFEVLGKSTLGKPFVALTITSADNMRQLPHYLEIQQRLADPRGLSAADAEKLIHEGRAIVLMTCTVHSTELASTQTAMQYVYSLLSEDTPEHRAILDNNIFLLIPSLNPDGQDMVVKWYRKYLGTPFEGTQPVELYHPYVGHDNNRDWYMFTQVESQLAVSKLHNVWHPQIVYDVHQMGPFAARIFTPPFLDPVDPNIDPVLVQETNMLGMNMGWDLSSSGQEGVAVNAMYDYWSPARHYQAYHGGVRILTESASARLASPMRVRFDQLDTQSLGYSAKRASWNFPAVWHGGDWHLGDIVRDQLIAFESCLYHVAQNREMFLRNFYNVGVRASTPHGAPFAYVVPSAQKDVPAMVKMLNTLRFGMVEVHRARQPFTADGLSYPAGSYVILMSQPYGRYAKTLLERQRYPDLREYPGGPPKRPYDVTAQTLPLLMGVRVVEVDAPFQADLEKLDSVPLPAGKVESGHKQYLLRPDSNNAFLAVNRLLKAGAPVSRITSATHEASREFPAGSFLVPAGNAKQVAELGLDLLPADRPPANAVVVKAPRIGIYVSYMASMDEGWTRWLLEQFEFPYTRLHDADVRAGGLKDRFDVIILPDQNVNAIVNGHPRRDSAGTGGTAETEGAPRGGGPVPDEFTGGLGQPGVAALRAFAVAGGTLVTLNSASNFAAERLPVGARNVLQGTANKDFYGPGSILRVNVDPNHPVAYGMDREAAIWFEQGPVFASTFENNDAGDTEVVATYPNGNPLMSGWLLGDGLLQGRSALVDAPVGEGHVVMFGFRPQYRGQSYGTFKMLFNALFYFGAEAKAYAAHSSQGAAAAE